MDSLVGKILSYYELASVESLLAPAEGSGGITYSWILNSSTPQTTAQRGIWDDTALWIDTSVWWG